MDIVIPLTLPSPYQMLVLVEATKISYGDLNSNSITQKLPTGPQNSEQILEEVLLYLLMMNFLSPELKIYGGPVTGTVEL